MDTKIAPLSETAAPIGPGVRIGHVHLKVADLDRALAFYCGVLGFTLTQRIGAQAAFVSAGGYHHHIGLNTWQSRGGPQPTADMVGLRFFRIDVSTEEEITRVTTRLEAAGLPVERQERGIAVRDPWNNGIWLSAHAALPLTPLMSG